MYLLSAGNDQEAGKPENTRHGAHCKSNKHADDNLLHNIPLILQPAKAGARATNFRFTQNPRFLSRNTHLPSVLFREYIKAEVRKQRLEVREGCALAREYF